MLLPELHCFIMHRSVEDVIFSLDAQDVNSQSVALLDTIYFPASQAEILQSCASVSNACDVVHEVIVDWLVASFANTNSSNFMQAN